MATHLEIDRRDAFKLRSLASKLELLAHELEQEATTELRRVSIRLEIVTLTNELMQLELRKP